MLVVDASAVVDLLIRAPHGVRVLRAMETEEVVAPELIDVEVLSAIARQQRGGLLDAQEADRAIAKFNDLPLTRVSHVILTEAAWRLRHRARLSDGFYVACAELVNAPLMTTDGRLARASLPGISILLVN